MMHRFEIKADHLPVVNFALYQNRIPLIRRLKLYNGTDTDLKNGVIHIAFSPEIASPLDIPVGLLKSGCGTQVESVPVELSGEYLSSMTERVTARLSVSLRSGGTEVCSQVSSFELLTYDEWPGIATCPEIAAAFVTPNHPAINPVLRRASEILRDWRLDNTLDGYLSGSPQKVKFQMAAIYEALKEYQIAYCLPPASFDAGSQRIRLAHTVLGDKLACCIDMAFLYAGCLEAAGLNPLVIIQDHHAFAGCHLLCYHLPDPYTDDASLLIKRCAEGINEMMVVETTGMESGCIASFDEAVERANAELGEISKFNLAIDVKRARLSHILPLPLTVDGSVDPSQMTAYVLKNTQPGSIGETDDIDPDSKELVTKQKIWERHLLDLSLRNNLLNAHPCKDTMQILAPNLQSLERAVSQGKALHLSHYPVEWDQQNTKAKTFHSLAVDKSGCELVEMELKQSRLHTFLPEDKMETGLKHLAYTSRTSVEESGANSLYLALGMLRFTDAESGSIIHAPVILYPVELGRKSAASGYVIKSRDEDPVLNITLIEYLRQMYQIRIGGLDPLPREGCGIDVSMILNSFRRAVMHKKGWDVEEHAVLGIFSFSKHVMWNDIHLGEKVFEKNPIIHSLKEGRIDPELAGAQESDLIPPEDAIRDLILPLEADSSQIDVIAAALRGESFVIHGAPGTGKSQTITNIIANMLFRGKRVLFVAEKQAALDVVLNRLEAIGIADFCLPLHSNKARKGAVLEHFRNLIELSREHDTVPFPEESKKLAQLRREMESHVISMNKVHPAGYSLNDCISAYLSSDGMLMAGMNPGEWTAEDFALRLSSVEDYTNACRIVGTPSEHPFYGSTLTELPPLDTLKSLEELESGMSALRTSHAALWLKLFPGTTVPTSKKALESFACLCQDLQTSPGLPLRSVITLDEKKIKAAKAGVKSGIQYQAERRKILVDFKESIFGLSSEELKDKLAEINTKDFISKAIERRRLSGRLKGHTQSGSSPDWPQMEALAAGLAHVEKNEAQIRKAEDILAVIFETDWNDGLCNDWQHLKQQLDALETLWNDLRELPTSDVEFGALCSAFAESAAKVLQGDVAHFLTQLESCRGQMDKVGAALKLRFDDQGTWIDSVVSSVGKWRKNFSSLRDWVIYNSKRTEMVSLGLEPLVSMVEGNKLSSDGIVPCFMRTFYRSYAEYIIASDASLTLFHGLIFEDKARKFREANECLKSLACKNLRGQLTDSLPSFLKAASEGNEVGILQKCIRNGCRGMSLRNLFSQIPELFPKMCPCMLMSPISVAQYLTADAPKFDLVIFDEASQIPTCEAIGAMARGNSVIVVGDPNQMPPTDFFMADSFDEENAGLEDLESVLDDCLALSLPSRHLLWHYRSKHESLIAFSNMNFYGNRLLTFPSTDDLSSRLHFQLVRGTYDRGGSRQNAAEADAIVEEIRLRFSDPSQAEKSIGVVTFNTNQQSLIEDRINEMFKKHPDIEKKAQSASEPIFVKNLENVQGDERDVILFSVGYGVDDKGFMSLNFGPLNREGGWRRLNVAISRARYEMKVFSTITADQIDLNRTSAEGVAGLKAFLEYAEKGRDALRYRISESAQTDDGLVLAVAEDLRRCGFDVRTNIGCSGYRIDIGIVNPDDTDKYLACIICDSRNYAAARTTQDRELVQLNTLQQLGWTVLRLWSLDYWTDPEKTISSLAARIDERKT